jgi:hypothetical protein
MDIKIFFAVVFLLGSIVFGASSCATPEMPGPTNPSVLSQCLKNPDLEFCDSFKQKNK